MKVAALFVQKGGAYFGMPDVDPWDEARDARLYDGPFPVVAHPPCARWCRLAAFVEHVHGYKIGDDGGCFASALASVRRWGGVLEHPAYTKAWAAHALPRPPREGWGYTLCGGAVCQVEQRHYGHRASKPTWLYVHGFAEEIAPLLWGTAPKPETSPLVGRLISQGLRARGVVVERMGKAERSRTPSEFKAILLDLARSVYRAREAA